jgi:hypothetical protein
MQAYMPLKQVLNRDYAHAVCGIFFIGVPKQLHSRAMSNKARGGSADGTAG